MLLEEQRVHQAGAERADSYTFNPHKWMFTNFDCNVLYVADRAPLIETLAILPPYLLNAASESGAVIDYRDWHVPLGRRFRALKLWWVLRSYGAQGIRHHLREHIAMAAALAGRVRRRTRGSRCVAPVSFALVCFAHVDGDDATAALAEAINATGRLHVTPSVIDDERFIRVSIGQTRTTQADVDRLWAAVDASA